MNVIWLNITEISITIYLKMTVDNIWEDKNKKNTHIHTQNFLKASKVKGT